MGRKIRQILEGQAPLPFRAGSSGLLSYAHPLERYAFFLFGALLAVLSVAYIYFVIASVMDVAARGELAQSGTKISAEVARMEAEYLTRTSAITESVARNHGFVSIRERSFVEKADSVSLNISR